jgi:hypothetical protein
MNTRLHLTAYLAASVFALFGTHAYANSQQEKMTTCNADATAKKLSGDERSAYMKTCLSAKPASTAKKSNSQQEKMTTCNADATAKKLSGDERKAYMKTCLSGPSSASAHAATAPAKQ